MIGTSSQPGRFGGPKITPVLLFNGPPQLTPMEVTCSFMTPKRPQRFSFRSRPSFSSRIFSFRGISCRVPTDHRYLRSADINPYVFVHMILLLVPSYMKNLPHNRGQSYGYGGQYFDVYNSLIFLTVSAAGCTDLLYNVIARTSALPHNTFELAPVIPDAATFPCSITKQTGRKCPWYLRRWR